MKIHPQQFE